jgi:hypothetical protein
MEIEETELTMYEHGARAREVGPGRGVTTIWAVALIGIGATAVAHAPAALVPIELLLMWLVGGVAETVESAVRRGADGACG